MQTAFAIINFLSRIIFRKYKESVHLCKKKNQYPKYILFNLQLQIAFRQLIYKSL